ncbi:MAG TPA: serine/threonine protein kinase [bacterium]|nr:serine/threonine protein kinase [bacterium]
MQDLRADPLLSQTTEVKGYKVLPPCVLYARVGAGGMGAVYRGHHLNLDIEVAVKCLKPSLADDDPTFVDRFRREGRSAARINHQNVIRVFDVAEHLGLHYLIMEFVQGETARQRVERKGPLRVPEALEIVYESALGLGEAHRMGIIHRDIKPDNLLISSRGQVKVADLGLAKPTFSSGQSVVSMAGQVMGTPPYMPPEQWGDDPPTAAIDVWAMGAVLYYLLAGHEAIRGDSLPKVMNQIVLHDFPDIREVRDDVPDSVVTILRKATAKAPGERYRDGTALADAIAQLPEHRISLVDDDAGSTQVRTMLSPPPIKQIDEIKQILSSQKGGDSPPSRRSPMVTALLLALLASGAAGAWAFRSRLFSSRTASSPTADASAAEVRRLAAAGRYFEALRLTRVLQQRAPAEAAGIDASSFAERALFELETKVTFAPIAPVEPGGKVHVEGSVREIPLTEIDIAGTLVPIANGAFAADVEPAPDQNLAVSAYAAEGEAIPFALLSYTTTEPAGKPPTPTPITFVEELRTDPSLLPGDVVAGRRIKLLGSTSEGGLDLEVNGSPVVASWNDRAFEVVVDLPQEGANDLTLTARRRGTTTVATRSLRVVRLTQPPTAAFTAPPKDAFETDGRFYTLAVDADEWTTEVLGMLGDESFAFTRSGNRWTSPAIPLGSGRNGFLVTATNIARKTRNLSIDIYCTATGPALRSVAIETDGKTRAVAAGATIYVNQVPDIAVEVAETDAVVLVNGKRTDPRFRPSLRPGRRTDLAIEARWSKNPRLIGGDRRFTIVYDTTQPRLTAKSPLRAAANTEVTLTGRCSDDYGIASLQVQNGPAIQVTRGRWSITLKAGTRSRTITLVATDRAGNSSTAAVALNVTAGDKTKPVLADPPQPKLAPTIDPKLFTAIGEPNALGYPPALRHRGTRTELVAVDYGADRKPSFYVARTTITEGQWSGRGGNELRFSITAKEAFDKLRDPRFAGLSLPTSAQWNQARNAQGLGIAIGGRREWLGPEVERGLSRDMHWLWNGSRVEATKSTFSDAYTSFRVCFTPR